ncbi:protein fantom [Eurytemora carolleeae]|uniref:protein fantom n=1 Tax=Eurytemora carolleeae TaxID=1294199 RepID=UPI000C7906E1|nr:protein fantom [Eurytemora carolleeae]|eukprot:XP_023329673.1 protein fantom-like [Eurytemora affinis]
MDLDDDLIPTKDTSGGILEIDLSKPDALLLQQRSIVSRISREDLEDRYLRVLEENASLKKHAVKQEDKLKKLATKLIRVLSDKKRMENAAGGQGRIRDIETEELIEDQQQRIRELEQQNGGLREKLMVARNQIVGKPVRRHTPSTPLPPRAPSAQGYVPASPVPGYGPGHGHGQGNGHGYGQGNGQGPGNQTQLISQQAARLLEEARNENRQLEDQVNTIREQLNIYEQEIDQIKEQSRIKENNLEEEVSALKTQVSQSQRQTVAENIELIRVQRECKVKGSEIQSLKAQLEVTEENIRKLKVNF